MGQYYKIVNLDKREYIHPRSFGDGLKLMEFAASGDGTMCALAILLADGNGRGGGDFRDGGMMSGRWAGDRIVIAGDYADPGRHLPDDAEDKQSTLYGYASENFTDISEQVREAFSAAGEQLRS